VQQANTYQPLTMPLDAVAVEALDGEELQLQTGLEVAMHLDVVTIEMVVGKVLQGTTGGATWRLRRGEVGSGDGAGCCGGHGELDQGAMAACRGDAVCMEAT
jgi:hypothetical protein